MIYAHEDAMYLVWRHEAPRTPPLSASTVSARADCRSRGAGCDHGADAQPPHHPANNRAGPSATAVSTTPARLPTFHPRRSRRRHLRSSGDGDGGRCGRWRGAVLLPSPHTAPLAPPHLPSFEPSAVTEDVPSSFITPRTSPVGSRLAMKAGEKDASSFMRALGLDAGAAAADDAGVAQS